MREITHIDCFSGPGGICTGFHAAGIKTLVAIEFIQSCVDTYSANHPEVHVINSDIRAVYEKDILPYIPKGGVDIVSSGMPCETFSTAGNTSRSFYDDRQFLFREGIRIAKMCNAKLILFENVPAITTKKVARDSDELIIEVLKRELDEAGYNNYMQFILDASAYGVPQKRNRFFILASKDNSILISKPEPFNGIRTTVKDAILDLPNVIPNSGTEVKEYLNIASDYAHLMRDDHFWKRSGWDGKLSYQMAMKHRPCTIERFKLLQPGESLKNLFDRYKGEELEKLQEKRVLPQKMFIKRNYRLILDEQSPTVTSHCLDEFVHPIYDRALTVRECARLQSFPDSYDFCGGPYITPHLHNDIQDKYEQIGDAVPPLLAYAWAKKIIEILTIK